MSKLASAIVGVFGLMLMSFVSVWHLYETYHWKSVTFGLGLALALTAVVSDILREHAAQNQNQNQEKS